MDAVLEPTKQKVLETKTMLDTARITDQRADFENYLNGFSPNVQDILEHFKFRNQLQTLSKADAIGTLINKFLDPEIPPERRRTADVGALVLTPPHNDSGHIRRTTIPAAIRSQALTTSS